MTEPLTGRVGALEKRLAKVEDGHRTIVQHVERLDADIREIREVLRSTATKDDVNAAVRHIDSSINEILRDALNSVPARQATIWGSIMALIALATFAFGIMRAWH